MFENAGLYGAICIPASELSFFTDWASVRKKKIMPCRNVCTFCVNWIDEFWWWNWQHYYVTAQHTFQHYNQAYTTRSTTNIIGTCMGVPVDIPWFPANNLVWQHAFPQWGFFRDFSVPSVNTRLVAQTAQLQLPLTSFPISLFTNFPVILTLQS